MSTGSPAQWAPKLQQIPESALELISVILLVLMREVSDLLVLLQEGLLESNFWL